MYILHDYAPLNYQTTKSIHQPVRGSRYYSSSGEVAQVQFSASETRYTFAGEVPFLLLRSDELVGG